VRRFYLDKGPFQPSNYNFLQRDVDVGMQMDWIRTDNRKIVSISVIIFWIWIRIASNTDTNRIINEYEYGSDIIGYRMRIQI
jgi:hypothetical protein